MVDYCDFSFPEPGQEIGPGNWMVRYIPRNFLPELKDDSEKVYLARSALAPSDSDGTCSVDWYDALVANSAPSSRIQYQEKPLLLPYSLKISVSELNRHGLQVIYDPINDRDQTNCYHCGIIGYPGKTRANKKLAEKIIEDNKFDWIVKPHNLHP